jgi:hypothetical protein
VTAAQDWIDRDCSLNASGHPPQDSWGDDDATACGEKVTEVCRLAWRQRADVLLMEEAVRRVGLSGLSELAAVRVRFGYRRADRVVEARRLAGRWERIYRPYGDEGLTVRTEPRKKLASRAGAQPSLRDYWVVGHLGLLGRVNAEARALRSLLRACACSPARRPSIARVLRSQSTPRESRQ